MHLPGIGRLTLDEDLDWYYSEPVSSSSLRGATGRLVIGADLLGDVPPDDLTAVARAFLSGDDRSLTEASQHVHDYYLDTVREAGQQGWVLPVPRITEPADVWAQVGFGSEWHLERDHGFVYVSVECECAWEPEHGLQLVFRDGRTVTKVGPYDGHLTNAAAYARPELADVVYVSTDSP